MENLKFTVLDAGKAHIGRELTFNLNIPPHRITDYNAGKTYYIGIGWIDYNGYAWDVTVREYATHTFMLLERRGKKGKATHIVFKRVRLETSMWTEEND